MQHLIPIAFRDLLPVPVRKAITKQSLFFKMFTSPKLKMTDMRKLEVEI